MEQPIPIADRVKPFWVSLFVQPSVFFRQHLPDALQQRRLVLATVLVGIGSAIDRVDRKLMQYDLGGRYAEHAWLDSWPAYWGIALVAGLVGAYFIYLIGGWFYDLRLRWSGGGSQIEVSRALYIYSSLIVAVPTIAFTLAAVPFHARPYDPSREPDLLDLTTMVVVLFSVFYSVVVSFRGVTTLAEVDRTRAVIWFLVLPWLFYAFAFTAIIGLIWTTFGKVL